MDIPYVNLTESKEGLFVSSDSSSQSPIVYVKMSWIDWLEMSK